MNLKVHPKGIEDFGAAEKYTPIDLVMRGNGCDFDTAFKFLADRLWESPRISFAETVEVVNDTGDAWRDPDTSYLGRSITKAPKFPLDVLTPKWKDWAIKSAEGRGSQVDYVVCSLLSAAGGLIGNRCWPQVHSQWQEPPVLWMGLVGEPSEKKSGGQKPSIGFIKTLEEEARRELKPELKRYEKEYAKAEADQGVWLKTIEEAAKAETAPSDEKKPELPEKPELPDMPVVPQVIVGDVTPEKLTIKAGEHQEGLLMHDDELAGWFGRFDLYPQPICRAP